MSRVTAEQLHHRLKDVMKTYHDLKKLGFSEDILVTYLQSKTKLSKKKVVQLLNNIDEFYENLIQVETSEKV